MTDPSAPGQAAAGPSIRAVPEGDDRPRLICPDCGYVAYENPKLVVGVVCSWDDRVLLCRRAIEPRKGYWTLPAGYLELNETVTDGVHREAWEEARAKLELDGLLAVYDIPRISQVQLIYRGRLVSPAVEAGPESAEVALFAWEALPWDDLAFPTVRWALQRWHTTMGAALGQPTGNPADPG